MDKLVVISQEELTALIERCVKDAISEQLPVLVKEPSSEFIGIEEAMVFLGLAKQTIYGLTSKKLIPFCKQHKLYFKPSELDAWIESGRQMPPPK